MAGRAGSSVEAGPLPAPTDGMEPSRAAADGFARAVAARDYVAMFSALARDASFHYLIPPGPGQTEGAAEVAAKFLEWFGDADEVRIERILVEPLADRTSLRYRFLRHEQDRWKEVEQQLYVDVDERGLICAIDLLCSGFRPAEDPEAKGSSERMHRFDAGALGCGDGLAREFRRRILAIPVGDALLVETSDPAAKEDLPPLARMMGHTVRSVEPSGNGRLLITVERGR
jgi:TusA-related sulfurtransferase